MMNGVGGTAMHYMAQAWRLNPWDFKVVSETTRRYGASRIPAGSTVEDWPLGYEDLEPYYDRVEYELGVSGNAGNIKGTKIEAGNIFEGPRAARLSDAGASQHRVHGQDVRGGAILEAASVHRTGRDHQPSVRRPAGLRVSRLLHRRRLPRQRQELAGGEHDSEGAEDRAFRGCHRSPRDANRSGPRRPRERRHVRKGQCRVHFSRQTWCSSPARPTRTSVSCCSRSRHRSRTGFRTTTLRSDGTTSVMRSSAA